MKVNSNVYVILTKNTPIVFLTERGELTDVFDEAFLFSERELAETALSHCDKPDLFEIREGMITFNI